MKKIISFLLLLLISGSFRLVYAQQNSDSPSVTREVHTMWKDKNLSVFGYYKPYTTIKLYNGNTVVAETMSDALGKFEVTVKEIDPSDFTTLVLKGFDRYGREISDVRATNANTTSVENIISVEVSPGIIYEGQATDPMLKIPVPDATVKVYDTKGQLITQTTTDSQGNFAFTGVPKNSSLVISKEGYDIIKQSVVREDLAIVMTKNENSTSTTVEPNTKTEVTIVTENSSDNTLSFPIILGAAIIVIGIIFIGYKLRKKAKSTSL